MGRNLSSILRKEAEPLTIMLQDNMLKNYYRQNDMVNWAYERGASILGKLAHENPNMRIIELGAGTGGATMPMLRQLGHRFAHLDFTDVSTGFFESAKAEQAEWAERISKLCSMWTTHIRLSRHGVLLLSRLSQARYRAGPS